MIKTKETSSGRVFNVRGEPNTDNSVDEQIFNAVIVNNEYKIDERVQGGIVIDIGANIGCFSFLCIEKGASEIHAFEPQERNFEMLSMNIKGPRFFVYNKAVWRSDKEDAVLCFHNGQHEGAGFVTNNDGDSKVKTIAFDDIVRSIVNKGNRVRLLKIDCEGSEFPILYTSKMLEYVDEIVGELHFFSWLYNNNNDERGVPRPGDHPLGLDDLPYETDAETFFLFLKNQGFTNIQYGRSIPEGYSLGGMDFSASRR